MRSFQTKQSVNKTNVSDGLFKPVTQQSLPQNRNQAVRNTNVLKPGMFRIASTTTQNRTPQLPHTSRNTNPHMSKSSGVIHSTSVSRPQLKCYQVKDKVVPNNSHVKFQKKEVEDHHRIFSISKKTKSVTACNDSSNSRTSNANAVCAECGTCVFNSNHDACVSRYLKDVNARTKKPHVVPISASKPKRKANKSVATPPSVQASVINVQRRLIAADQASVVNVKWCLLKITLQAPSGLVLHQMTSDHNRSELGIQDHSNEPSSSKLVPKVVPLAVKTATSRQELESLFHHHIAMLRTTGRRKGTIHMIQPEPEDLPKDNPKIRNSSP
ncbi:hypothetical protein Tco_0710451 [Tanacetum coccineum]